jgi:hypothetical protein
MKTDRSGARASPQASVKRNASLVLKTIKVVKTGTYKVQKGGLGGKYLVERRLPLSSYKLLLKRLEQEDENAGQGTEETLQGYVKNRLR